MTGLNLHEFKNELLLDFKGDCESNGLKDIGPVKQKTNIRFRNMDDFESYINAIDVDYDSADVTLTGYVYKLHAPQFKFVKRIAYVKGTNYLEKVIDYHGQNCSIPIFGMHFIKCIKYFTERDYTEEI